MNDISLSLIRDAMVDTISIMHYNRIAAASFLTAVDQFWAPGTFATRGITLDQLRNYPSNRSTWKPEDMFIDAVFSQLLVLPEAKQKLIYYHSIVFEACKHAPTAVAPTLGRGIRWIFRHIDDMDLELFYRYLDWFAHHLSNFEFRWKWTEWYVMSQAQQIPTTDNSALGSMNLRDLILRLRRLSLSLLSTRKCG